METRRFLVLCHGGFFCELRLLHADTSNEQNCYLCKKKLGACIQCSNRNCYTAYHVTCAREFGLEVRMKQPGSTGTNSGGELKSYCDKHGKVNVSFPRSLGVSTTSQLAD